MTKKTLKRINLSNPQIKAYESAVDKGRRSQYVVSSNKGWAVKRGDAKKASRVFDHKEKAICYARSVAKNTTSGLFVFNKDGSLQERRDYSVLN